MAESITDKMTLVTTDAQFAQFARTKFPEIWEQFIKRPSASLESSARFDRDGPSFSVTPAPSAPLAHLAPPSVPCRNLPPDAFVANKEENPISSSSDDEGFTLVTSKRKRASKRASEHTSDCASPTSTPAKKAVPSAHRPNTSAQLGNRAPKALPRLFSRTRPNGTMCPNGSQNTAQSIRINLASCRNQALQEYRSWQVLDRLYPLLCKKSKLLLRHKLHLYKVCMKPKTHKRSPRHALIPVSQGFPHTTNTHNTVDTTYTLDPNQTTSTDIINTRLIATLRRPRFRARRPSYTHAAYTRYTRVPGRFSPPRASDTGEGGRRTDPSLSSTTE